MVATQKQLDAFYSKIEEDELLSLGIPSKEQIKTFADQLGMSPKEYRERLQERLRSLRQ